MDEVLQDKRFAGIAKDPRFRRMQRKDRKVKIDKRFQGMFKDKRFKMKYMVDKRGRPVNTTSNENLRHFYDLSESESDDDDVDESNEQPSASSSKKSSEVSKKGKEVAKKEKATAAEGKRTHRDSVCTSISKLAFDDEPEKLEEIETKRNKTVTQKGKVRQPVEKPARLTRSDSSSTSGIEADSEEEQDEELLEERGSDAVEESDSGGDNSEDDDEDSASDNLDVAQGPDYARGEGLLESSDEESDYEFEEEDIEHGWGELDHDAPPAESITKRLAVCNMDWDRIKAADLMVLLNSFKPTGGLICSISIYPSEFGMKRLKEDNERGPLELRQKSKDGTKSNTEGEYYHRERLRQYQLNRLKYYYAVVECDSADTANHIYTNCDGLEYEASATRLDLRFIPDDMTFDQEPKSVERNTPDTSTYKPTVFTNTALQQSKVRLTWDETDQDRLAVTMRNFKKDEIEEMDVRDYLASDTDGDEDPYGDFGQQPQFGEVEEEDSDDDGGKSRIQKYKQLLDEIKQSEAKKPENAMEMEISWEPGLKETTEELVKKKSKKEETTAWDQYLDKKREKTKKKRQEKQSQKPKVEENAAFSDDEIPAGVDLDDPYFKDELDQAPGTSTGKKEKKKGRKKKPRLTPEEEEEKEQEGAELALLMMDEDDTKAHFSLKGIQDQEKQKSKKKRKKKRDVGAVPQDQDSFQLDTDDARFKALYDNPHFNIDPSAPEFKKTKAIDTLIESKLKRRVIQQQTTGGAGSSRKHKLQEPDEPCCSKTPRQDVDNLPTEARRKDTSLANLVKSVKAKTLTLQQKQKNRQKFGLH